MPTTPKWTYRHAKQLHNHWWWRPGWQVGTRFYAWHITVENQRALHVLADRYQAELGTVPGLDLIPRRCLHLTMQGVGFVENITDDQLAAILDNARARLANLEPVTVRFHRPVIRPEAIALPPAPLEPIERLRAIVRQAIADVSGPDGVPDAADGYQPHISLAYVNTDQSAADARRAIERVHTEPADMLVSAVSLIKMHRDNRMYEWQTVDAVPLGPSR